MRLLLISAFLFISSFSAFAQPILLSEITMGYGIETFYTLDQGSPISNYVGLGATVNFGAPLVTGVLNFSDDPYWKIGDTYIMDTWTAQFSFGATLPLNFFVSGFVNLISYILHSNLRFIFCNLPASVWAETLPA